MAIISCERCGEHSAKAENCNYCKKLVCYGCIKSQKRAKKLLRYFICKSCWSSMSSRSSFKSV